MWSLLTKIEAMKPIEFLRRALSEQDGTPSLSRYTAFLITVATIAWVTYVTLHTGLLPDLTSAALFIAGGHGGYAINKVGDSFGKKDM